MDLAVEVCQPVAVGLQSSECLCMSEDKHTTGSNLKQPSVMAAKVEETKRMFYPALVQVLIVPTQSRLFDQ